MEASSSGNLASVEYPVGRGARVRQADNAGLTAWMHASLIEHTACAGYLLAHGAQAG